MRTDLSVLSILRSQIIPKDEEINISPQDERLIFVKSWLGQSPGGQDLFKAWEKMKERREKRICVGVREVVNGPSIEEGPADHVDTGSGTELLDFCRGRFIPFHIGPRVRPKHASQ